VYPGLPHLNLWPESVRSLGLDPGSLVPVLPQSRKGIWHTSAGYVANPATLRCVCVLSKDEPAGIVRLPPQQAFVSILRNVPVMIARMIAGTSRELECFPQCTRLAGSVPMYRINQPHTEESLASVGRLAEQIEETVLGQAS